MNPVTRYPARFGLILLSIFVALSIFFIFEYAKKERSRDMMDWQLRLSILADIRVASIEELLSDSKNKLEELSENATLKLYLSQYKQFSADDLAMQAQFSHVRNLLQASSSRFGFISQVTGPGNLEQKEKAYQGLAVLSDSGDMLFSTGGFYRNISVHDKQIKRILKSGKGELVDLFEVGGGRFLFGNIQPVFHIQNLEKRKSIGAVVALYDPDSGLYDRLSNLHVNTKTDETILLRKSGKDIEFISPMKSGLKIMHKVPFQRMEYVFQNQSVLSIRNDYSNKKVLSVSRQVKSTPWLLIQKIDASEALKESDDHQKSLFFTFFLISLLLASMFIAVWRHSTSIRLLKITGDLEARTALLNAVSENINEHIFLIDENQKFIFANHSLAKSMDVEVQDIYGKNIASVLGSEVAKKLQKLSCEENAIDNECVISLLIGENECIYHVSSMVLQKGNYIKNRLFVLHDITGIKSAEEKRERLSRGIISTLVKAVDLHDPYCMEHSERTKEVSMDIAHELGLEQSRCEALEMAALLANIGKLFVSKEILTKMDALTDKESEDLRQNITYAIDVLKELEFEGPVVDIISQKNEYIDGSGYPKGLHADEIMLEAKILAVSNALVAMASSRAYREGRPIKEVINILLESSGVLYDRHVVAALFHISENKSDWEKWQNVSH